MPAQTRLFPCRSDNYGVLLHDPETGAPATLAKAIRDVLGSEQPDRAHHARIQAACSNRRPVVHIGVAEPKVRRPAIQSVVVAAGHNRTVKPPHRPRRHGTRVSLDFSGRPRQVSREPRSRPSERRHRIHQHGHPAPKYLPHLANYVLKVGVSRVLANYMEANVFAFAEQAWMTEARRTFSSR